MHKDLENRRLAQIERHLNRIGSAVEGNQKFQAERITDVMDLIDELRKDVDELKETVSKARSAYADLKKSMNGEES